MCAPFRHSWTADLEWPPHPATVSDTSVNVGTNPFRTSLLGCLRNITVGSYRQHAVGSALSKVGRPTELACSLVSTATVSWAEFTSASSLLVFYVPISLLPHRPPHFRRAEHLHSLTAPSWLPGVNSPPNACSAKAPRGPHAGSPSICPSPWLCGFFSSTGPHRPQPGPLHTLTAFLQRDRWLDSPALPARWSGTRLRGSWCWLPFFQPSQCPTVSWKPSLHHFFQLVSCRRTTPSALQEQNRCP